MRKKFTTIALVAVLGTLAAGCQKDDIAEPTCLVAENDNTAYTARSPASGSSSNSS